MKKLAFFALLSLLFASQSLACDKHKKANKENSNTQEQTTQEDKAS